MGLIKIYEDGTEKIEVETEKDSLCLRLEEAYSSAPGSVEWKLQNSFEVQGLCALRNLKSVIEDIFKSWETIEIRCYIGEPFTGRGEALILTQDLFEETHTPFLDLQETKWDKKYRKNGVTEHLLSAKRCLDEKILADEYLKGHLNCLCPEKIVIANGCYDLREIAKARPKAIISRVPSNAEIESWKENDYKCPIYVPKGRSLETLLSKVRDYEPLEILPKDDGWGYLLCKYKNDAKR